MQVYSRLIKPVQSTKAKQSKIGFRRISKVGIVLQTDVEKWWNNSFKGNLGFVVEFFTFTSLHWLD